MTFFKHATLAAIIATVTLGAATVQAGDIEIRKYSPNIDISNSYKLDKRSHTTIDNSQRRWVKQDYRYNYNQDNLNANQTYNQKRKYSSAVNQGASNSAGDTGHQMNQYQGGTHVNMSSADSRSHAQGGLNLLSPSSSSHSGLTSKGNLELYGSQIGGNQSGFQGGDNTNLQNNSQTQYGSATTGSMDYLRNGNRNH